MELFPTCRHGRDEGGCVFCAPPVRPEPHKLARASDPETSKAAARSVSHELKDSHQWILNWLTIHGPATDDEMAVAAVEAGLVARTESARRQVRTLRERHGLIVPAVDKHTGFQLTFVNASGRQALGWRAKES